MTPIRRKHLLCLFFKVTVSSAALEMQARQCSSYCQRAWAGLRPGGETDESCWGVHAKRKYRKLEKTKNNVSGRADGYL